MSVAINDKVVELDLSIAVEQTEKLIVDAPKSYGGLAVEAFANVSLLGLQFSDRLCTTSQIQGIHVCD